LMREVFNQRPTALGALGGLPNPSCSQRERLQEMIE